MKNQKGFIQIPTLMVIIVSGLVLAGISYVSMRQYQSDQLKSPKNTEINITQDAQNSQQTEIDSLKKEIESIKNAKPTTSNTITKAVPQKSVPSLASIVNQWRPRIAHIECKWYGPNGNLLTDVLGSGLLSKDLMNTNFVFTNKHVITNEWEQIPSTCTIRLPESTEISTIAVQQTNSNDPYSWTISTDKDFDVGQLFIKNPTPYIVSTASQIDYCKKRASVGDQLIILGYPGIGSQTDITATEGIVSGYDGGYYITSAKVEHGNSGGAAILLKDNCYLGIPSYVDSGELESLARILDFNFYYATSFGGNLYK